MSISQLISSLIVFLSIFLSLSSSSNVSFIFCLYFLSSLFSKECLLYKKRAILRRPNIVMQPPILVRPPKQVTAVMVTTWKGLLSLLYLISMRKALSSPYPLQLSTQQGKPAGNQKLLQFLYWSLGIPSCHRLVKFLNKNGLICVLQKLPKGSSSDVNGFFSILSPVNSMLLPLYKRYSLLLEQTKGSPIQTKSRRKYCELVMKIYQQWGEVRSMQQKRASACSSQIIVMLMGLSGTSSGMQQVRLAWKSEQSSGSFIKSQKSQAFTLNLRSVFSRKPVSVSPSRLMSYSSQTSLACTVV
ncbi:hypothetical protein FGO68_gene7158 [Halteria grandinella]|uniref:Uncharacterized protein n=1 Tax=Halteria grandinella TaxID=5974 RepID=A0A8J8T2P2_HALGN|nr:hypothetical protein FGO68_gene7158 [Halteria grandinella]